MRKLLAILLAITMVLTLGACGSGSKKDKDDEKDKKSGSGYEEALDMALAYFFEFDTKNTQKLMPDFLWSAMAEEEGMETDEAVAYFNESAEDTKADYEAEGIEIEYEVAELEKLDEDDLDELLEDVADNYDGYLSMDDFGDQGYYAYVTSEYYSDGELLEEGDYDLCVIQIDGGWYVVSDYGNFLIFGYGY